MLLTKQMFNFFKISTDLTMQTDHYCSFFILTLPFSQLLIISFRL